MTAPYRTRPAGLAVKVRQTYRGEGWPGLLSAMLRKSVQLVRRRQGAGPGAGPDGVVEAPPGVRRYAFSDFHSPDCVGLLHLLNPDLGVLAGTNILRESVFGVPRLGCINLHSGKAPEYRGAAPGFWELYNGEREVGITIHRVEAKLDAGSILLQECFPLDPAPAGDPLAYLGDYRRDVLRPEGTRLLVEAVRRIAENPSQGWEQDHSRARTYPKPTYRDVTELRRRIRGRRRQLPARGARRALKTVLGWACFHSGLYRRFFRDKGVVVLFHRVDDGLKHNPISCTREDFAAFCDFFRRFFVVVSLEEFLNQVRAGQDVSRQLVITFDDGYRDNWALAAGALRRRCLSACFFVATEFIGSTKVPWWDAERQIRPRWMTWDNVRALRRDGFEIGSHTMNHVDLGVVEHEEAAREVEESRKRLEHELDSPVCFFSYPYGGPHQITEESREAVRRAGYTCCLSAFGGVVRRDDDPFHLRRTPISPWHTSPYQLGFELMAMRNDG